MGVPTTPDTMHLMILASLAAVASAAPQIVPYEHVEIPAEPYIHEEIEALPYIHEEPELDALSLGIINRNNAVAAPVATPVAAPVAVAPQQFAAPVAPQQFAAPVAPQQFIPQAQVFSQQQFVQPRQVAALPWNGACINNLGAAVPCSQ